MQPETRNHLTDWLIAFDADTRRAYRNDLDQFDDWLNGTDLLDVDRARIQRYLGHLTEDLGRSPATVSRKRSSISSFYTYLVQEKILPNSPAAHVRPPRGESAPRYGLDLEQAQSLLTAAEEHSTSAAALCWLMAGAGLRVAEACNAKAEDLDKDLLTVTTKGHHRQTKPLSPPVLAAVQAAIGDRTEGPILTNRDGLRLTPPRARELVTRLAQQVELKDVTPHVLRATAATLALQAGAGVEQVQQLLGHKQLETTLIYLRNRDLLGEARQAARMLGDRLSFGPKDAAPPNAALPTADQAKDRGR